MSVKILSAFGYQGDNMNLPVANVDEAVPFYVSKMGFTLVEQSNESHKKAVLERDGIRFAIAENGGDPEQDGCAFHVDNVEELHAEFASTLARLGIIDHETRDDGSRFKVFFVVAPDGLCYWFGEKLS